MFPLGLQAGEFLRLLVFALGILSPIVAPVRFFFVTRNLVIRRWVLKDSTHGFYALVGFGGYMLFLGGLLAYGYVVVVTLFFMETGSASGVPLAIAALSFPVIWLFSEALLFVSFRSTHQETE